MKRKLESNLNADNYTDNHNIIDQHKINIDMLQLVQLASRDSKHITTIAELHELLELSFWNSTSLDTAAISVITNYLKNNTNNIKLTTLCLNYAEIGAEGATAIAAALEQNTTITEINFGGNNIGTTGAKAIAAALKQNTTITYIDLSGNNIGAEGAKAIAAALEQNTTITDIDLSYNIMGVEGAKAIAPALAKNTTITYIALGGNKIGAGGAISIAAVLAKNTTITYIALGGNKIGTEGAKAIAAALEQNTTITTIDLSYNIMGVEGAKVIAAALEQNTTITTINFYENNIGAAGTEALAAVLNASKYLRIYGIDFYNAEITQLNEQHELAYKNVVQHIKIAIDELSPQSFTAEQLSAVQEALKIKATVIDQLFTGEPDIQAMFASPVVFGQMLKIQNTANTAKIASGEIKTIAQLYSKLHAHSSKHIFTMKGVCKDMQQLDDTNDTTELTQGHNKVTTLDAHNGVTANDSENTTIARAHKLTISDLPSDMLREICKYLSPSDILLAKPTESVLIEQSEGMTTTNHTEETTIIGEVA